MGTPLNPGPKKLNLYIASTAAATTGNIRNGRQRLNPEMMAILHHQELDINQ